MSISNRDVAILDYHDGAAGQVSAWFEQVTGLRIACYVYESVEPLVIDPAIENTRRVSQRVEYPRSDSFMGRSLIVSSDWISELQRMGIGRVLPLTGANRVRHEQIRACREAGIELVSAIHPTATVLDEAIISGGVWVNARAIIGYKAELAEGVIVNTGAIIDHHNVMESCAQADPGVVTAGFVTFRECCQVHTAAVIKNRVTIGKDSVVGAGAVVIRDVAAGTTVAGVPAVPLPRG